MNKILLGRWIYLVFFLLLFLSVFHLSAFAQTTDNSCSQETPSSAPNLYQISVSSGSATLYFAQPNSIFTGYTISYGLTKEADSYSVSFDQGSIDGAVKYTVNDLYPKTNYYFKVRANNGCAAGPWSTTLSSRPATLPITGPGNLWIFGLLGIILVFAGTSLAIKFK